MVNTEIDYIYRDASNYKAYPEDDVIVSGSVDGWLFDAALQPDRMFIPADLSLSELQSQPDNYPSADDHIDMALAEHKKIDVKAEAVFLLPGHNLPVKMLQSDEWQKLETTELVQ